MMNLRVLLQHFDPEQLVALDLVLQMMEKYDINIRELTLAQLVDLLKTFIDADLLEVKEIHLLDD